jgi:hypothetical protein
MDAKMTRRQWLGSLFAGLAGAWASRQVPAAVTPPAPPAAAPVRGTPAATSYGEVTVYSYDAVGRLTSICDPHGTTYVHGPTYSTYLGGAGRPARRPVARTVFRCTGA